MDCPRCEHVHKTTSPCECHCHVDPTWTGEGMGKPRKLPMRTDEFVWSCWNCDYTDKGIDTLRDHLDVHSKREE